MIAPKNLRQNVLFRKRILDACNKPDGIELRRDVISRCASDIVFFFDAFCWTYAVKDSADSPDVPFVLYPFQEGVVKRLAESFGNHPLLIEKSRDLGATWLTTTAILWRWLFKPSQSFLIASRKQEFVDKSGDPKTLFWKLDYCLAMLPGWMRPSPNLILRNNLHIGNQQNGSVIDGESTNSDLGRGDRRTAILLDEFAAVDTGAEVLAATRDATRCRLFVSTPQGSAGAFYEMRQTMLKHNPEYVLRLHWSEHPLKNVGLYQATDAGIQFFDNFKFPHGYEFVRDGKLRSVWYDEQCKQATSEVEIAAELDISFENSGGPIIRHEILQALLKRAKPPLLHGDLSYDDAGRSPKWTPKEGGDIKSRLLLWIPLSARNEPPESKYVIAADVAMGTGSSHSSSSVLSVVDEKTKMKVARFKSNSIYPQHLGIYAVALARWFHDAKLNWEANAGCGGTFGQVVTRDLRYRNVWMKDSSEFSMDRKKTSTPGWWSGKDQKRMLFAEYVRALADGKFYNPSEEGLNELREYVYTIENTVEHDKSRRSRVLGETGSDHGDECVSDAIAWKTVSDSASIAAVNPEAILNFPVGSFGWRRQQFRAQQRDSRFY